MNSSALLKNITFNLTSVGFGKVGKDWNYKNIISSFARLYLVTGGEAYVYMGDKKIQLCPGNLYLIPGFTNCSYVCEEEMTHYYATFAILLPDNLSIFQFFNFENKLEAADEDITYFKKLLEVNPNMELPASDPKIYQRLNSARWNYGIKSVKRSLVSSGLLYLLFSNFVGEVKIDIEKKDANNLLRTIKYIHSNIDKDINVSKLAEMSFLSKGHFTRRFHHLSHMTPLEYVNKQRIEKAQMLLNTTSYSCIEIAEFCGFKSNGYFCKVFKKQIGQTPVEYRKSLV